MEVQPTLAPEMTMPARAPLDLTSFFGPANDPATVGTMARGLVGSEILKIAAEIRELTPDTDHLLSAASQSYVRIVLAVINMSGVDRNVKWTAALQTLGVDDAAAAASGLSMATVAPNPVSTITSITFTTAAPAPLTLGLYDSRGALVRTLIDGRQYESGEHTITSDLSDLPNGVYLARLTQNEHAVSTSIVVVK